VDKTMISVESPDVIPKTSWVESFSLSGFGATTISLPGTTSG